MAKFYFGHRVIGFTKHSPDVDSTFNLPIHDFNTIQTKFSPDDVEIFAPLNDNFTRARIYDEIKYKKDIVYRHISILLLMSGTQAL